MVGKVTKPVPDAARPSGRFTRRVQRARAASGTRFREVGKQMVGEIGNLQKHTVTRYVKYLDVG